jgi:hypothetical protein
VWDAHGDLLRAFLKKNNEEFAAREAGQDAGTFESIGKTLAQD